MPKYPLTPKWVLTINSSQRPIMFNQSHLITNKVPSLYGYIIQIVMLLQHNKRIKYTTSHTNLVLQHLFQKAWNLIPIKSQINDLIYLILSETQQIVMITNTQKMTQIIKKLLLYISKSHLVIKPYVKVKMKRIKSKKVRRILLKRVSNYRSKNKI